MSNGITHVAGQAAAAAETKFQQEHARNLILQATLRDALVLLSRYKRVHDAAFLPHECNCGLCVQYEFVATQGKNQLK